MFRNTDKNRSSLSLLSDAPRGRALGGLGPLLAAITDTKDSLPSADASSEGDATSYSIIRSSASLGYSVHLMIDIFCLDQYKKTTQLALSSSEVIPSGSGGSCSQEPTGALVDIALARHAEYDSPKGRDIGATAAMSHSRNSCHSCDEPAAFCPSSRSSMLQSSLFYSVSVGVMIDLFLADAHTKSLILSRSASEQYDGEGYSGDHPVGARVGIVLRDKSEAAAQSCPLFMARAQKASTTVDDVPSEAPSSRQSSLAQRSIHGKNKSLSESPNIHSIRSAGGLYHVDLPNDTSFSSLSYSVSVGVMIDLFLADAHTKSLILSRSASEQYDGEGYSGDHPVGARVGIVLRDKGAAGEDIAAATAATSKEYRDIPLLHTLYLDYYAEKFNHYHTYQDELLDLISQFYRQKEHLSPPAEDEASQASHKDERLHSRRSDDISRARNDIDIILLCKEESRTRQAVVSDYYNEYVRYLDIIQLIREETSTRQAIISDYYNLCFNDIFLPHMAGMIAINKNARARRRVLGPIDLDSYCDHLAELDRALEDGSRLHSSLAMPMGDSSDGFNSVFSELLLLLMRSLELKPGDGGHNSGSAPAPDCIEGSIIMQILTFFDRYIGDMQAKQRRLLLELLQLRNDSKHFSLLDTLDKTQCQLASSDVGARADVYYLLLFQLRAALSDMVLLCSRMAAERDFAATPGDDVRVDSHWCRGSDAKGLGDGSPAYSKLADALQLLLPSLYADGARETNGASHAGSLVRAPSVQQNPHSSLRRDNLSLVSLGYSHGRSYDAPIGGAETHAGITGRAPLGRIINTNYLTTVPLLSHSSKPLQHLCRVRPRTAGASRTPSRPWPHRQNFIGDQAPTPSALDSSLKAVERDSTPRSPGDDRGILSQPDGASQYLRVPAELTLLLAQALVRANKVTRSALQQLTSLLTASTNELEMGQKRIHEVRDYIDKVTRGVFIAGTDANTKSAETNGSSRAKARLERGPAFNEWATGVIKDLLAQRAELKKQLITNELGNEDSAGLSDITSIPNVSDVAHSSDHANSVLSLREAASYGAGRSRAGGQPAGCGPYLQLLRQQERELLEANRLIQSLKRRNHNEDLMKSQP